MVSESVLIRSTACSTATPMQSSTKRTRLPSPSANAAAIGASHTSGTRLPFGPVEMAAHDDLCALFGQFPDRRK